MEDVERKMVLARGGVLVLVHVKGQRGVQGHLLWGDGGILVLEKFCPCGINGWTRLAEVKWKGWVHLSVHCVACPIEEEKVVEFNRTAIVWKRGRGNCL